MYGPYIAALGQPQLAKSDGHGAAGEGKTAAMDLPAPLHLALQRLIYPGHGICRGQGEVRQRGRGMERLQDTCLT